MSLSSASPNHWKFQYQMPLCHVSAIMRKRQKRWQPTAGQETVGWAAPRCAMRAASVHVLPSSEPIGWAGVSLAVSADCGRNAGGKGGETRHGSGRGETRHGSGRDDAERGCEGLRVGRLPSRVERRPSTR